MEVRTWIGEGCGITHVLLFATIHVLIHVHTSHACIYSSLWHVRQDTSMLMKISCWWKMYRKALVTVDCAPYIILAFSESFAHEFTHLNKLHACMVMHSSPVYFTIITCFLIWVGPYHSVRWSYKTFGQPSVWINKNNFIGGASKWIGIATAYWIVHLFVYVKNLLVWAYM